MILNDNVKGFEKQHFIINNQSVSSNGSIYIDFNNYLLDEILILDSGMYLINVACQFMEPCTVGLYTNNNEQVSQETIVADNYYFLLIHYVLKLELESRLSIKYLSIGENKIINSDNEIKIWKI